jgi:hypothetical protein
VRRDVGASLPPESGAGPEIEHQLATLGDAVRARHDLRDRADGGARLGRSESRGLPTLYCNVVSHDNNQTFSPVFSVRPRIVIVDSADGGELVVRWATWTHASATGTGTAHPDHGQYPVGVRASDAVGGRFMHLAITSDLDGRHYVDHLHLAYVIGDALGWER